MKNFIDFTAQHFDSNGNPLTWGQVMCYEAGTVNPKSLYTDAALTVQAPNPLPLMADGRPQYQVFMGVGNYKFRYDIADLDNNGQPLGTYQQGYKVADNVEGEVPPFSANSLVEYVLQTVTELRLIDGNAVSYNIANCLSYDGQKKNQIGGGRFKWDPVSALADNGGTVFNYNNNAQGRWLRVFEDNVLYPQMFGVSVSSGVVAQSSAFENAIEYLKAETTNGLKMIVPRGDYNLGGSVQFDGAIDVTLEAGVQFSSAVNGTVSLECDYMQIDGKIPLIVGPNLLLTIACGNKLKVYPEWWMTDGANGVDIIQKMSNGLAEKSVDETIIDRLFALNASASPLNALIYNARIKNGGSFFNYGTSNFLAFKGSFVNDNDTPCLGLDVPCYGYFCYDTSLLDCPAMVNWFGVNHTVQSFNSVILAVTGNARIQGRMGCSQNIAISAGGLSVKLTNNLLDWSLEFFKGAYVTLNVANVYLGFIKSEYPCIANTAYYPYVDNGLIEYKWFGYTNVASGAHKTWNKTGIVQALNVSHINGRRLTSANAKVYIDGAMTISGINAAFDNFSLIGDSIVVTITGAVNFQARNSTFNCILQTSYLSNVQVEGCTFLTQGLSNLESVVTKGRITSSYFYSYSGSWTFANVVVNACTVEKKSGSCYLTLSNVTATGCEFLGNTVFVDLGSNVSTNRLYSGKMRIQVPTNGIVCNNNTLQQGTDGDTYIEINGDGAGYISQLTCCGNRSNSLTTQPIKYVGIAAYGHTYNTVKDNNPLPNPFVAGYIAYQDGTESIVEGNLATGGTGGSGAIAHGYFDIRRYPPALRKYDATYSPVIKSINAYSIAGAGGIISTSQGINDFYVKAWCAFDDLYGADMSFIMTEVAE